MQPVLRSPLTISSAGVSREYLELITRDVVVLILSADEIMERIFTLTNTKVGSDY